MLSKTRLLFGLMVALLYGGAVSSAIADNQSLSLTSQAAPTAQQCGTISSSQQLQYPINRRNFFLINPFSRPNARFDGRLHTGDDWIRFEGDTLGEPVYAIGPGRVTYANPTGWGRDKGVIITQHVLASGDTFYALYGHIEENEEITFPTSGSCVNTGDVLGVIGAPRPAPHLHFEIRLFDPFDPGPGYWPIDPQLEGWLNPSQFLDNWQGWLNPAYQWHIGAGNANGVFPPPVLLEDNTLVYVEGRLLNFLSADGRLIRQYRMADSVEAVGLIASDGGVLMATRDGRLLGWSLADGLIGQWATDMATIASGPYPIGDVVLLGNDNGELFVFSNAQQVRLASYPDAGHIRKVVSNNRLVALLTTTTIFIFDEQGDNLAQLAVGANSDIHVTPTGLLIGDGDGTLSLWRSDGTAQIRLTHYDLQHTDSQMALAGDKLLIWGLGSPLRLTALALDGTIRWETDIFDISEQDMARAQLQIINRCSAVLLSPQGILLLFDHRNGQLVGKLTLWGQNRTNVWLAPYANDGILRFQVAEQIAAYDVAQLSGLSGDYCR